MPWVEKVRGHLPLTCCLFAAFLSLWIRTGIPVSAIAGAIFDDALFVKLSGSIGSGHWLGPFDDLTLVKGMFYPLFILCSFFLGVPLKISEQIVYLAACYYVARAIEPKAKSISAWPAVLFCTLALDPVLWTSALARVIREGLYISETLALVLMATSLAFHAFSNRWRTGSTWVLSVSAGLVAAAFWLTREEGLWILPSLAVGVLVAAASAMRSARLGGSKLVPAAARSLRNAALPFGLSLVAFSLPVIAVATVNLRHYGVFETTEVQSYAFRRAYAALAGIEQDNWRRFVVFPKDARERAYRVSPAARELAPSLDGTSGENWRRGGCDQSGLGGRDECPEILAGWFQWAFRDAVAAAGHYGSGKEAATYYGQLADQIETACRQGELRCLPPRATLAPPFRWSYLGDTLQRLPAVVSILTSFGSGWIAPQPSVGPDGQIAFMAGIVGPVEPPPPVPATITGWIKTAGPLPVLKVRDSAGGSPKATVDVSSEPDVAEAFPGSSAERFSFDTEDLGPNGLFELENPQSGEITSVPLASLSTETEFQRGDLTIHVDPGPSPLRTTPSGKREQLITRVAAGIAAIYSALAIPLALCATLGLILAPIRLPASAASFPYALALACGAGVVSRLGLLTYLDVTSIPSANILYLSPAAPLLIVFTTVGCAFLVKVSVAAAGAMPGSRRRATSDAARRSR